MGTSLDLNWWLTFGFLASVEMSKSISATRVQIFLGRIYVGLSAFLLLCLLGLY